MAFGARTWDGGNGNHRNTSSRRKKTAPGRAKKCSICTRCWRCTSWPRGERAKDRSGKSTCGKRSRGLYHVSTEYCFRVVSSWWPSCQILEFFPVLIASLTFNRQLAVFKTFSGCCLRRFSFRPTRGARSSLSLSLSAFYLVPFGVSSHDHTSFSHRLGKNLCQATLAGLWPMFLCCVLNDVSLRKSVVALEAFKH